MNSLRAHVENGRIVVDEPAELPDGTLLHVVVVTNDEERAALDQSIEGGLEDFEKGDFEDFAAVLSDLRKRA